MALRPGLVLVLACAGVFLAALDQTVVVTALPDIFLDIEVPVTDLDQGSWIITGYLLGYTGAMPLMGRISDAYGHSRIYIASMLLFVLGSALVASGDSLGWIVGARVVQAIGGGALVPVTIAMAHESLAPSRRAIIIGVVVAIAEAGAVLGPLYGGLFLEFLDWRWIFWVNLPVGAMILLAMLPTARGDRRREVTVDYAGGLLLGGSVVTLALGISGDVVLPSGAGWQAGLLVAAVGLLLLFLRRQAHTDHPLLPLGMLRNVRLASANGVNLLVGGGLILVLVNIPLMTDTVMGEQPLEGGLRLLRLTVMIPIGAVIGGLLYQRSGYRLPVFIGLALAALGFGLLSRWPIDVGDPRLTLELMVGGLGFGLVVTPITLAALNNAAEFQQATATALVTVMRMVGMIVALSALSSWGQSRFETLAGQVATPLRIVGESDAVFQERLLEFEAQLANAGLTFFHEVFLSALIICLVALIPAYFLGRKPNVGAA